MAKNKSADEEEYLEPKPYEYFEQTVSRKVHHFYLSNEISDPWDYVKMCHMIQNTEAHDMIHIHLNTPGGDLTTGVQIINSMKATDALVTCSLEGEANSLGSLIFLAADQFLIHDNSLMLIHNLSHSVYGKGRESAQHMEATLKWFEALAYKYYVPFLTEQEVDDVLDDRDMWLHADDIRKRLNKMIKIQKRELKEMEG